LRQQVVAAFDGQSGRHPGARRGDTRNERGCRRKRLL